MVPHTAYHKEGFKSKTVEAVALALAGSLNGRPYALLSSRYRQPL